MTIQSSLFVVVLAGFSVAGAAVGVHREAIVDQAEDVFKTIAFSGQGADLVATKSVQPEAAPSALVASSLPIKPPDTHDQVIGALIPKPVKVVRILPKVSKITAPSPDVAEVVLSGVPPRTPDFVEPPLETADLTGLTAVELMQRAAKEKPASTPSQLDLILSSMRAVRKEEKFIPELVEDAVEMRLDTPHKKQMEQAVEVASSAASTKPVMRPKPRLVKHSEKPQEGSEQPAYSAKHYHNLRYHLNGRNRQSQVACVAELRLIASYTQVYFDIGSSVLDGRGASAARLVAAKAQSCPEAEVSIIGFTDPGGSEELNKQISWNRANGVFRAIKDAGFSTENIEVSSHVEDHPENCVHFEGIDRRVVFDIHEASDL